MYKQHIYQRMTHRYADGWRHLDQEEFVGTVKVLAPTRQTEPESYDEGGETRFRIVAPPALKGQDLSLAIRQTLSGSGCRHEYDCCGCASTRASVKRVSPREYAVRVAVSYNY
jgi:hypothetical protein